MKRIFRKRSDFILLLFALKMSFATLKTLSMLAEDAGTQNKCKAIRDKNLNRSAFLFKYCSGLKSGSRCSTTDSLRQASSSSSTLEGPVLGGRLGIKDVNSFLLSAASVGLGTDPPCHLLPLRLHCCLSSPLLLPYPT